MISLQVLIWLVKSAADQRLPKEWSSNCLLAWGVMSILSRHMNGNSSFTRIALRKYNASNYTKLGELKTTQDLHITPAGLQQ